MGVRWIPHGYRMPHYLDTVVAGPWVLAVVFVVAGLDALLPFMPNESTVVACGVAAAGTGRPHLDLLVVAAASGAFPGDQIFFPIGRRSAETGRFIQWWRTHRRTRAVHAWVRRLLHSRGGLPVQPLLMVFALVGYPPVRFHRYTAAGVLLWAIQAALLGYLGGSVFASRPILGLLPAWVSALAFSGLAVLLQHRLPSPAAHHRQAAAPEPESVKSI